jgi:ABC transport system ATP-binding/permease protein
LDRVAEKILAFETDGVIQHFVGNYSDYLEYQRKQLMLSEPGNKTDAKKQSPDQNGNAVSRQKERPLKLTFKEQRELDVIEGIIAGVEQELVEVKAKINQAGSNYQVLQELTIVQEDLEQKLEGLMERWAYLNELALEISKKKI